jgi:flagellar biosynthesis component FlhA
MRVKEQDLKNKLKQALMNKPDLSAESQAMLFSQADSLLAKRREHRRLQEADSKRMIRAGARVRLSLQKAVSRLIEILAIRPDIPAAATAFLALILAFLALHGSHTRSSPTSSELPDFPKYNDSPARYDAQRLAEQQAYEREVEDAHQKTSGGL